MALFMDKANEKLINEWHYKKNVNIDIREITSGSPIKVWWKCDKGHEWQSTVSHRLNGTNCPICSGRKILIGYNDLFSLNPKLSEEWNYAKNDPLIPQMVTCNSNKRVWWKCKKCEKEWISSVSDRNRGQGCPSCAKSSRAKKRSTPNPGDSLLDNNENLSKEWNYTKNGSLLPSMVFANSSKIVWWICENGHEWKASINNRARGTKCPYCSGRKALLGFNDLSTTHPKIAMEWNYDRNGKLTPQMITGGSNKKVWWKCDKGHEWKVSPNSRVYQNSGCPICSSHQLLIGYNDFQTKYPELLKEWNYKKNKKKPYEYPTASKARIWWICSKGHEWSCTIGNRTVLKRGCPVCAKELRTSFPEQAIFYYVKHHFQDSINGDRSILNGSELDIYIPSIRTGIEYDGYEWHKRSTAKEKDNNKNETCIQYGIKLYRIREDGLCSFNNCNCIMRTNNTNDNDLVRSISVLLSSLGVSKFDIDLDRDRNRIQEDYIIHEKENSLESVYPEIASTWNYDKNGKLTPSMVSSHSNKRVWWKCKNGHEWIVSINNRIRVSECPICENSRFEEGYNDLLTLYPDLAKEWNYEKNAPLTPNKVKYNTSNKVWWKCKKGHEWETIPYNRYAHTKTGCPYCAIEKNAVKRTIPSDGNSLADLFPNIANEWNHDKNGQLLPSMVKPKSPKKVWWKCDKGHEWEAKIQNRTILGRGCPYCSGRYVIIGKTDLETTNPALAKEWNYNKNGDLKPSEVLPHTAKKVWWMCEKGHEWQATINSRSSGCGCPYCAGRKKTNQK